MENMEIKEQVLNTHLAAVEKLWQENQDNEFVRKLRESNLEEAIKALPGFKEAFKDLLDTVDCSDGRVLSGRKLGLAGSGILLEGEDWGTGRTLGW